MKKPIITLTILLLAVVLSAGCIQEPDNPDSPPAPAFKSVDVYLSMLNEMYSLDLTEEEIQNYADELDSGYLKNAKRTEGGIWIDDIIEFQNEVTQVMNLNPEIHNDIINRLENPDAYEDKPTDITPAPESPKPTEPGVPVLPTPYA